jgi:hypothetical protein
MLTNSDLSNKDSINQCINNIEKLISYYHPIEKGTKENIAEPEKYQNKNSVDDNNDIHYKDYYLFYQEENGDIYYIEPFLMEILLAEYGDYNSLPVEIEGDILDKRMVQVTHKLKNENKYLSHLNDDSIIFFVEIDINDIISSSTKEKYVEILFRKEKLRNLLKNEENKYEKFVQKRNEKLFEEEKNNITTDDSKNSLDYIFYPIFTEKEEEKNNNEVEKSKTKSKLYSLFEERERDELKKKKKIRNKNILNKGGKKGKKIKINDNKKVFDYENDDDFSISDSDN